MHDHPAVLFGFLLRTSALLCGAALATTSPGAPAVVAAPPGAASAPRSVQLHADVMALIGDAECDEQQQCRLAGVGAKPCGGPSSYLAWSAKRTELGALRSALEAQARAEMDENTAAGLASDCKVTPMPAVVCRPRAVDGKKVCQLGRGGADSAI